MATLTLPPTTEVQITRVVKALYDAAPGNLYLNAFKEYAAENGGVVGVADGLLYEHRNMSNADLAQLIVDNLGLAKVDEATGATGANSAAENAKAFLLWQFNVAAQTGASRGQVLVDALNNLATLGSDPIFGKAADFFNASIAQAYSYSIDPAHSTYDLAVLQQADEVTIGEGGAPSVPGKTFTLTTGVDNIVGTAGNDTINANPGASNANTFTALDNIDGGGGTDTFNVTEIGGTGASPYTLNTAATVKNIEVLNYTVASDNVDDTVTADVSAWTGLTTANIVISGTDAPVTGLTTKGNVTTVTINGATTASITDSAAVGSDKLATVTLVDTTGLATITSDAVTTLTLNGASGGATVSATAGARALTLNLNNVTAGTVTDATATSLTINASGAASSGATVAAAAATSVSINADEALSLTALNVGAATGLTVTGDSLVTLAGGTFTALASIDASAQTAGGVDTKAFALGNNVSFTGGAGNDSIQLGATTKAITMGAGNDRVLLSAGTTALGSGGSIDAGAGTGDVIAFADGDDAGTATATSTFAGTISNFETVELAGAAGAAVTLNLANLDNIANVTLSADLTKALTISNMASGGTLKVTSSQTGATTVGVTNANVGTNDVVNISVAGTAAVNTGSLTIADVETVNYATDDTATTPTGIAHVSNLTAAAVKTITVAGDAGLALTNTNTTVTSFDASGVTKGAVTWTTGALAAASTITGGAGNDTLNASAALAAVTLNGGAGNDTLTGSSTKANTINGGDGNDTIVGGSAADTINGGAGNDTITTGTGLDVVTGGAGNDTFILSVNANGNTYATITDAAAGDVLTFVDKGTETFTTAKITLADTAVFQDYLDAAAAGDGSTNGQIKWFQYAGNTYVVEDMSAAATFQNGVDLVVKLTGLVDLSTATGAGTNAITLA